MAKTRKSPADGHTTSHAFTPRIAAIAVCVIWWFYVVWKIQDALESHLRETRSLLDRMTDPPPPTRFLIFTGADQGTQGEGNIVTGLLAAHLHGMEFDRVVCLWTEWHAFHVAFRQKRHARECAELQASEENFERIHSWNFGTSMNECDLRAKLGSDAIALRFSSNTYPKWADVPPDFFDRFYEPTEALLSVLPWRGGSPPKVVVHLRAGDDAEDKRKGLDDGTLEVLGKRLPPTTFLVTNKVPWYDYFSTRFGWSNPGWSSVDHSAFGEQSNWGKVKGPAVGDGKDVPAAVASLSAKEVGWLHLYSDWYTILRAREVYHTVSDFSQSAVHWMGMPSKIIMGHTKEGELDLLDDAWIRDEPWSLLRFRPVSKLTDLHGNRCRVSSDMPRDDVEVPIVVQKLISYYGGIRKPRVPT